MSMTIAVTRNAPNRFRGFFASCMLEVTPGVYVAPRMKKAIRERVWKTVMEWSELLPADAGIILFWKSRNAASGLGMKLVGWPQTELVDHEGTWLAVRQLTKAHDREELDALSVPSNEEDSSTGDESTSTLCHHLPELQ